VTAEKCCATCGGRKGQCIDCVSYDYCVHAFPVGDADVEVDICVGCSGLYHRHTFTVRSEEQGDAT
jgi:hypothetical protein